jgi:hypothetical protein
VTILIIGSVLLGALLGRFFKVWILIPTGAVAVIAAFASSFFHYQGLLGVFFECAVLLTCLQIGYVSGLFSRPIPSKLRQLGKTRAAPRRAAAAGEHGGLPEPAFFLKRRTNDD